ncbi:hypothetical protein D3C73_205210 [compost metagenome]|jgi:hypothetical protein
MVTGLLKGSRIFHLCWIFVFLGSCSVVQTIDNRTTVFSFQLTDETAEQPCGEFKRTVYLQHVRPQFPKVDITKLTPDEINDVLLAHTEKVKQYIDHEEQYLREDINRHNMKCGRVASPVFQK